MAIAAAYRFNDTCDPLAVEMQQRLADAGIDATLAAVSGILPGEPLTQQVRFYYQALAAEGLNL